MAAKITIPSATPKPRAPCKPKTQTIYSLSRQEIKERAVNRALKEIRKLIDSHAYDDPIWKVVGHVCPFGDPVAGIKEIRRLLNESMAK